MMKTKISLLIAALTLAFGCSQEDEVYPDQPVPEQENATMAGVTWNPETGKTVATNYYEYDFLDWDNRKESELSTARTGGQIWHEIVRNDGSVPSANLETYVDLPVGYVLTGLGLRVHRGNVTTMETEYRYVSSSGTLGQRYRHRTGREPDHALEVWFAAPDQHIITGIGTRVHHGNVTTLVIYYQRVTLDPSDRYVVLEPDRYVAKVGSEPHHALEINTLIRKWVGGIYGDRIAISGIGFRCHEGNMTTMRCRIGIFDQGDDQYFGL